MNSSKKILYFYIWADVKSAYIIGGMEQFVHSAAEKIVFDAYIAVKGWQTMLPIYNTIIFSYWCI